MPRTEPVPIRLDDWPDEDFVARLPDAEAFAALCSQTLEAHESRCERIVRRVMTRVADLPLPAADPPAE